MKTQTQAVEATVVGWTDGGDADIFEDAAGNRWVFAADGGDATAAVHAAGVTDLPGGAEPTGDGAGVFHWTLDTVDRGRIVPSPEGETYQAADGTEWVVRGGRWGAAE